MCVFVHAQGIKTVHAGGGWGSKNGKILFTQLLMTPNHQPIWQPRHYPVTSVKTFYWYLLWAKGSKKCLQVFLLFFCSGKLLPLQMWKLFCHMEWENLCKHVKTNVLRKMYMHELFLMSIKNDMIIIQFKFVVLTSIKYRVNNQLFEVQEWHANSFEGLNIFLLHFGAFFHASLLSTGVDNKKVEVDNEKALELTNSTVFHRWIS